jgi:lysophospholipid acyltransferase (LPLAT)-like uncharacterized protein
MTWRVDSRGIEAYDQTLRDGARCVFAFWHSRMIPLVWTHRGRGAMVLVSQHRDGELVARVAQWMGFTTARGSSTRGGDEGARQLLRAAADGTLIAITPDGPRGPAEQVKPGLLHIASRAGLPVVPVASASSASWVIRSWDRLHVPKPFARVVVAYGDPIPVPGDLDDAGAERLAGTVGEALQRLVATTRARAGESA